MKEVVNLLLSKQETKQAFDDSMRAADEIISEMKSLPDDLLSESRHEQYSALNDRFRDEMEWSQKLLQNISRGKYRFVRPKSGIWGFISLPLGELPISMPVLHATRENLKKVKGRGFAGVAVFVFAMAMAALLSVMFPALLWSPAVKAFIYMSAQFGNLLAFGTLVLVFAAISIFMLRGRQIDSFEGGAIIRASMYEEQWLRAGSENWSWGQRAYSCVIFALSNALIFILPLLVIVIFTAVGACLMVVYLRGYRRTGSVEYATIASAKANAAFNWALPIGSLLSLIAINFFAIFM